MIISQLPFRFILYALVCTVSQISASNGTHGELCNSETLCSPDLICNEDGHCGCDPSTSIFDTLSNSCGLKLGSLCTESEACFGNSQCSFSICDCADGYHPIENGTCKASFEMSCGNHWTEDCDSDEGLICESGTCRCTYGKLQKYNGTLRKCLSLVDGPCGEDEECIVNSHCSSIHRHKTCQCDEGFVAVDNRCFLSYEQPCLQITGLPNGDPLPEFLCDPLAPLKCISGKCECGALEAYDKGRFKCRGVVGAPCNPNEDQEHRRVGYCVNGAKCVALRVGFRPGYAQVEGICDCVMGWTATEDRICSPNTILKQARID